MCSATSLLQRLRAGLITCIMSMCITSQPIYAAEHIAPTPWSSIVSSDLSRLMPKSEVRQLIAGETEFVSLHREYMSAEQRAVVLIIPDWQNLPTNNAGVNFLRTHLNDLGYTTIAMTVPDINWQASNEDTQTENTDPATENSQQTTDTNETKSSAEQTAQDPETTAKHVDTIEYVSDDIIDDYKENLIARFEVLYQTALNDGDKIVLVAQGASAGVLIEHYASFPNDDLEAFVSLSSYLPNNERNQQLNTLVSTISPPLLDIFYSNDNPDLLLSVANRKRWVKRHSKYDYRQRQLFGLRSEPAQHARLTKEIDGFLRRLF